MTDFSHYSKTTVSMVERYLLRGGRASEELMAEELGYLDPPLFPKKAMDQIFFDLDPLTERRGRPKSTTLSRKRFSQSILKIRRNDVPHRFRSSLAARVALGKRFSGLHRSLLFERRHRAKMRDMYIRGIYAELYDLIEPKKKVIHHKILGEFPVPKDGTNRSEKALALTHTILSGHLNLDPPSERRMMNIIAQSPFSKRRPRTRVIDSRSYSR